MNPMESQAQEQAQRTEPQSASGEKKQLTLEELDQVRGGYALMAKRSYFVKEGAREVELVEED